MAILAFIALTLQPPLAANPARPADAPRETLISAPPNEAPRNSPVPSRIRSRAQEGWVIDSTAAMYLREWAACTVRNKRALSVALLATQLNSPEQRDIVDQLTGRRFARRTICARFRTMRIDNLVLRGAIAEALRRWEDDRRRLAGPVTRPRAPAETGSVVSLAQAGYCVNERQPEGVQRLMATRLGTQNSARAMEDLRDTMDACLPGNLRAADFHPILLRGALGEPYFLSRRGERPSEGAISPAT